MKSYQLHCGIYFIYLSYLAAMGVVPSPFDCSQLNRSLKTLALRMREHMKNGLLVGQYLEKHPLVEKVIHPGKICCLHPFN